MDSWERFDENTIPPKDAFYSELNLENITDNHYENVKKVWETFQIKNLGEYYDFYAQCDTFLPADVFENFRNLCLNEYGLDPVHFLSAPGIAWQACLKKTKVKLELLTDIDMLLMVEKGTRGGICQTINRHAKANDKYMKNFDKNNHKIIINRIFRCLQLIWMGVVSKITSKWFQMGRRVIKI